MSQSSPDPIIFPLWGESNILKINKAVKLEFHVFFVCLYKAARVLAEASLLQDLCRGTSRETFQEVTVLVLG